MAFSGAGLPINIAGDAQEAANILGLNDWNIQEGSYNGATFHWMVPPYNGLDPVAGLINYVTNAFGTNPKPNYGTWSNALNMQDAVTRKLTIYPVPNYNGFYVDDFGNNGVIVTITGLVWGPDYLDVLQKCKQAFMDVPAPGSSFQNPVGATTGNNFRTLNHIIYGQVPGPVYFMNVTDGASNSFWRAASFTLTLCVANPAYLYLTSSTPSWQQEAQSILNFAETLTISITQAFALLQTIDSQVSTGSILGSGRGLAVYQDIPVVNGTGKYIQSITQEIQNKLDDLNTVYENSMAFLVQSTGGEIKNSFWDSIEIDTSSLPVYLSNNEVFTEGDAAAVIEAYAIQVNAFILYAEQNNYQTALQENIFALKNGVVAMNNFAKAFLGQNQTTKTVEALAQTDLFSFMDQNGVAHTKFPEANDLNRGQWFSCLRIPPGATPVLP
jgi:hypothetical protein